MTTTTNFDEWLDTNEPASNEDAYALNHAVQHAASCGIYDAEMKGTQMFIRIGGNDEWLRLANNNAVSSFQKRVDGYCPDPDMGWEGSESFHNAMAKDD